MHPISPPTVYVFPGPVVPVYVPGPYPYAILTDDEIRELYRKNPKELTRFEYYRMITTAKTPDEREKYCREALELYDNFTYAANELAVATIQKDTPDSFCKVL